MMAENAYSTIIGKQAKERAVLTSIILEQVSVEAIFLLGASATQTKTTSIFCNEAMVASFIAHYYLLVLEKVRRLRQPNRGY